MSSRKGKKVSFYYPKNIQGVNVPEGSGISSAKKRQVRLARLSDAILGRKATVALGKTTVEIARGASQAIGMVIGDPHMRDRTQLRDLVPIKLLISARVHRLSFTHPSLDINAVLHDTGKKSIRKNKWNGKETSASNYSSYRNSMASLVKTEQHRLSRDGIIEDHFARQRSSTSRKTRLKPFDHNKPVVKGMRRLISKTYQSPSSLPTMNIDDVRLIHSRKVRSRSEGDPDKDTKNAIQGHLKDDTENLLSYAAPGQNFAAEVRKDSVLGQIGRYLPEISCRVPNSAICMELVNMSQPVKSTQPLVVEAPHILWGTARDPLFHEVAVDGCPFIDLRNFEFYPDSEIQKVEHSESLMLITSTVWVDYLPQHENMPSFGSVVRNNAADALEKANNLLNKNPSQERVTSSADNSFVRKDVGYADGEEKVHSGSSVILQEDADPQCEQAPHGSLSNCAQQKSSDTSLEVSSIKSYFLSEQQRPPSKYSIEFDSASKLSKREKSILSHSDAVEKYEDSIKQTVSYNGEVAYTSEWSKDKINASQQHSSLSLTKAAVSSAMEEKLDKSSSAGNSLKPVFLTEAATGGHQTLNGSSKKTLDLNELKMSSSLRGQAQDTSHPPSRIISLKDSVTVASDVSSKHSNNSAHASDLAKSSLDGNESIHFTSIASGTFASHPTKIETCQSNKTDTSIRHSHTPKSDFVECYASTCQSFGRHSAMEMSKPPNIEAPQSPEIKSHLLKSNSPPSINAPKNPEINTGICKNDAPPDVHAPDLPEINNFESVAPAITLAPESAESNHPIFENGAPPRIYAPESPKINNRILKDDETRDVHAPEFNEIISLNSSSETNTLVFKSDTPPSIHSPESPKINNRILKEDETPDVHAPEINEIISLNSCSETNNLIFKCVTPTIHAQVSPKEHNLILKEDETTDERAPEVYDINSLNPSSETNTLIFENDAPPSFRAPKSQEIKTQVFKTDASSTVSSLKVADVLGFREEWSTLKSLNKNESKSPANYEGHTLNMSCLSQSKGSTSRNTMEDDERNICSQRQSQSIQEGKSQTSLPVSGPAQSSKSPNIDSPYILVLDEIIYFNVVEFPDGDVIASFPVSVASVLSERTADDRDLPSGEPSELTLTFCQEPSMLDQVWGVEATVTFRCTIADPLRGRKFRLLNRKRPSRYKMNQETSTQKPEEKSTSGGQTMDDDHSSLKSESQVEDSIKGVQSDSNDFSSCAGMSVLLSKNLFYDAQVEPVAHELKRRRGERSPTSNESSSLYGGDLGNGGSFETEASQAIFNSLLSHPKRSLLLHKSVKVDQLDVCATHHPNSIEAEYEKPLNPATEPQRKRHEEDLHFDKGEDSSKRRSSLHLLLHNSKAYVMKNMAKYLSSTGEENDKLSFIRKDLIKQGNIMGSVGEESFKAALRANISDKWRRSSFSKQSTNLNSQQSSSCQAISASTVSQCSSEGALDTHPNASVGNFNFSEEIPRSRWLQLNPLIRTWTWIPTFLKLVFNLYTVLLVGAAFTIFFLCRH